MWALAEPNTQIALVSALPTNWMNVSNLPMLDNETLASFHWYPVIDDTQPSFDSVTQICDQVLTVVGATVRRSWNVIPMPVHQLSI